MKMLLRKKKNKWVQSDPTQSCGYFQNSGTGGKYKMDNEQEMTMAMENKQVTGAGGSYAEYI